MPRRRDDAITVDPVAAAAQLASTPWADRGHDVLGDVQAAMRKAEQDATDLGHHGPECALGHENVPGARFCAACGLAMDAAAPSARVSLDAARPKPASALTAEERDAREQQHQAALRAARELDSAAVSFVPSAGETVTIHFIEDGLTFAGVVWMRGQEITIGPDHPRWNEVKDWITLGRPGQVQRWGKQYFDAGPWPYGTTYVDGAGGFEQLSTEDKKGSFAGPGEQALRQADEAERRRAGAVPGPLAGLVSR